MSIDNRRADNHDKLHDKKITEYVNFVKFFAKIAFIYFALWQTAGDIDKKACFSGWAQKRRPRRPCSDILRQTGRSFPVFPFSHPSGFQK